MIIQLIRKISITSAFLLAAGLPVMAQATLNVASDARTGADIGVTELTGDITFTVLSGVTVAAPLLIEYTATVVNREASEIRIFGTGGLAGIAPAPVLSALPNTILINVPAGGKPGDSFSVRGVRVSLAGVQQAQVKASITGLSGTGNAISGGQSTVTVIDRIVRPFHAELKDNKPLSYENGVPVNVGAAMIIKEGFPDAFTDLVGVLGQTVPTRLRLRPVSPLPPGLEITYAAQAGSDSTMAILTTASGLEETVPREDGSTDALYIFMSAEGSRTTIESFEINISLYIIPTGTEVINFQVILEPIGAAFPGDQFPATDIPRYLERAVPDEADIITGFTELQFPFRSAQESITTGIAVTNTGDVEAKVQLSAHGAAGELIQGAGITNPVELTIEAKSQFGKMASEIFGAGFDALSAGTVRLEGNKPRLGGFYLQGDRTWARLDGALANVEAHQKWIWPVVFRQSPSPFTTLELFNPGSDAASVVLRLFDSKGATVGLDSIIALEAGGTAVRDFGQVFPGISLNTFAGGYITGESSRPLVARETFGNAVEFNTLSGQIESAGQRLHAPHFAAGGGFVTELTIVNLDTVATAALTLTLMDGGGNSIPIPGNPARVSILPRNQLNQTLHSLFPALAPSLTTGYIRVDVEPFVIAYFISIPPLAGSIRFSSADGRGSSALPLFFHPSADFVYSHVAQNAGYYTGVAILNPTVSTAAVTVELYRANGSLVGSYAVDMQPGGKFARLLVELIPAATGQLGGHIRIRSTVPVISFALFGTNDGLALGAIPAQNLGN